VRPRDPAPAFPVGEPAAPKHRALMALYRCWMSLCDSGLIPARHDFDVSRVTPALGATRLLEIDLAQLGDSESDDEVAMQDYRAVRELGIPLYHDIVAAGDDITHSYARLILPFAGDGRNVDRLMVCSADQEFTDLLKLLH
jgi:hypothetical protein